MIKYKMNTHAEVVTVDIIKIKWLEPFARYKFILTIEKHARKVGR